MIALKNTRSRYGLLSMVLHWFMALLIIALSGVGIYMVRLPISLAKLKWYGYHKEFGMLVLMLLIVRGLWRMINIIPRLPDHIPCWQQISARMMHRLFYFFMVTVPMTGWLLTSSAGLPAAFFGFFVFPDMLSANKGLMKSFTVLHMWLSYALIGAIVVHTLAALKHHFYDKDDVLRGILP